MISQLLLEMDEMNAVRMAFNKKYEISDVMVIAATNCPEMIDPSFLRLGMLLQFEE